MKKENARFTVVCTLGLLLTLLVYGLGCMMYASNASASFQHMMSVRLTAFVQNIRYGLHFGKDISTYYGMREELAECLRRLSETDALYVVDNTDGSVLFSAGEGLSGTLPESVAQLTDASAVVNGRLYSAVALTDGSRLLTEGGAERFLARRRAYFKRLALICSAGFLCVAAAMALLWKLVKDRKKAYGGLLAMLYIWVFLVSAYVGYSAYRTYGESISELGDAIDVSVRSDMQSLAAQGVDMAYVSDIDGYLARYAENIPEIETIVMENGAPAYMLSKSYLRSVYIDYILQTLLFLTFSALILTEYQLYMSGAETFEG